MSPSGFQRANPGTIVTVDRRVSRGLRREYDYARRAAGHRVWEAPDILPYHAWVTRLWREQAARDPVATPVLLSRVQEDALWQQAILRSPAAHDLLDVSSTAAMAARAWDLLHEWELPRGEAAFLDTNDTQAFFEWMTTFEDQLRANSWITASQLPRVLVDDGISIMGPVSYAGFVEVPPREARLLRHAHATELPMAAATRGALKGGALKECCAADTCSELTQAAMWARAKLQHVSLEQTKPPIKIAVMIPGLAGIAATAERIFDDVLHPSFAFTPEFAAADRERRLFHISVGVASDQVPLIATALLVLGLEPGLTLTEAGVLLRSPFLKMDRVGAAERDARLRRRRAAKICFEGVASVLPDLAQHAAKMFQDRERTSDPSEWAALFSDLVSSAGWAERSPHASERQAVEHWKDLLSQLASLDLMTGPVSYSRALEHLRRIARHSRFNANEDQNEDAPVQIMDLREGAAADLTFDALWIAGLHAGAWPPAARPNPFVPLALQKAAGLAECTPSLTVERARKATARLKQSAAEVVLSYPVMEGEQELRPSPFVTNGIADGITTGEAGDAAAPDTALQRVYNSGSLLQDLPVTRAAVRAGAAQSYRGGARVLEDQAACPFKAFAVHRLGARELDAPELGVSPRERGTAVHAALETLWGKLQSQAELRSLSAEDLRGLIHECGEAAIREKSEAPERFRRLELKRLEHLLHEWLKQELLRPAFELQQSEVDHEALVGGMLLKLRPDRIDRYEDGSLAILDYKTGKQLNVDQWDGERPDAPQLPLYAVSAENEGQKVSEVMFVQLAGGKIKMHRRGGGELRYSLPEWKRILTRLAGEFVAGEAAVDPKKGKKSCEWCRLHSLCRVDELGLLSSSENEIGDGEAE